MASRVMALLLGLSVVGGACSPSDRGSLPQAVAAAEPSPTSSMIPTSTSSPTPTPVTTTLPPSPPRPPSPSATAILRSAIAVEPAARLPLTPGAEVVVHPAATFEVELAARAADARLVLVDGREDLVPATSTREVGAGTRLVLAPAAPLVPGSRYALRVDGAVDRDLHDDAGRAFAAVTLPLLAAGSPPPPEPKKAAKRRRRH